LRNTKQMQTSENYSALLDYWNTTYRSVGGSEDDTTASTGIISLAKCYESFSSAEDQPSNNNTGKKKKLSFLNLSKDELFLVLEQKSPQYSICEKLEALVMTNDNGEKVVEYEPVRGLVYNDYFDFIRAEYGNGNNGHVKLYVKS